VQNSKQFAIGEINETYERYIFNRRDQHEGESSEAFLTAIRSLVKTCRCCDECVNSLIRDRIVLGIKDTTTQQILLRERTLTLEKNVEFVVAREKLSASKQMKLLTVNECNLHRVAAVKQSLMCTADL